MNQFAGKSGVGTEHLIVCLVDRIKSLLDQPGMNAVIVANCDWKNAFDRTDPTRSISKLIRMGVRSSLISIMIEFIEDRSMSVRYNQSESDLFTLIGGSPQGSWSGQNMYQVASDDNAHCVDQDNRYKYCDDLQILELVWLADCLQEYNFLQHVASDIGTDHLFLSPQDYNTQQSLNTISTWTKDNLMKHNEEKSDYIIFTHARQKFSTRLTLNNKLLERKKFTKIVGVYLQDSGKWSKNTREILKKAYKRVGMLTKLKYAGVCRKDLIDIYIKFIRSVTEYCCVAWHSSLTQKQSNSLESIQSICLKIILGRDYTTYSEALSKCNLQTLFDRREDRVLKFSLKCIKHPQNKRLFPLNKNVRSGLRRIEPFQVNFSHTSDYKNSAIPYCQRKLNTYMTRKAPIPLGN